MYSILIAIAVVSIVGLIAAVLLALASHFLSVKEDETYVKVRQALPGVNCGACGYTGCDEYAKAIVNDGAEINLCIPGADSASAEIAKITGKEFEDVVEMIANVRCNGTCEATTKIAQYDGINTCSGASMIYGGPNSCRFGCIGCGDCVGVCPNNAIYLADGIAHVFEQKCIGCGLCAKKCPKGIIEIIPQVAVSVIKCSNKDKGAVARKACKKACIACKKCENSCPTSAITVIDNLAHIDYNKCGYCENCSKVCPTGAIKYIK